MDPILPEHILLDFQGEPLWMWLANYGDRITPVTMRNIVEGQRLILVRRRKRPLLVVAQHDAGQHVNLMGLRLRGRNYNDVVSPAHIHEGVWDLYILPDALEQLLAGPAPAAAAAAAPAAAAQPQDPEETVFEESLQMASAAGAGGAAAAYSSPNDPTNIMNNDPINPPKKSKGGKRRRHLSKKKRHSMKRRKTHRSKSRFRKI